MTTESAASVLVIDGCPVDCGKKVLEHAGFGSFTFLRITDLGMEKGKSPADEARVSLAVEKAETLVG